MRKILVLMVLISIIAAGCDNQDLTKQQYYDNGLQFLEVGNANGAIISFKKAIEKDQNFFEARFQLASAYIIKHKYESAERELLKVKRLNPSSDDMHVSLAKVYLNTERIDAALQEIDAYLSKKDDNAEAYEIAAKVYAAQEDYKRAEETLDTALKKFPGNISLKILLAEIYLSSGEINKVDSLVNEVLEAENDNKKALYLLAKIKNMRGESAEAIEAYTRILDIDSTDITALFELGFTYLKNNDLEKARVTAEQFLAAHSKRPEGHYLMGLVNFHDKKIDDAIISLQRTVKKAPIAGAHYYLGLSHLSKGNLGQAVSELQKVIDVQPEMLQARLMLAVVHLKSRRPEEAKREVDIVLERDGQNAFAHNLLGSIYLALGEGDSAMEEFDRAIALNPKLVDAHMKKGVFNLLSGDAASAEKAFMDAVEIAPDLLNNRIILARYYIKNKKYGLAINTLKDGLEETSNDAVLYSMIGAAHMGNNEMDKARSNFNKAISSNPDYYSPYFNLALLHLNDNKHEEAMKEYKRVLNLDGKNVRALLMTAKVLESDNRGAEALSYYMKAKEQGAPVAYMALAEYYLKKQQRQKAIDLLEEALSDNPENMKLMEMKGGLYMAADEHENALSLYKRMKSVSPEIGGRRLAWVYAAMGDYDKGITELKGLLSGNENNMEVMAQLAGIYLKKEDYGAAEETARKMIAIKPESDGGYKTLIKVYIANQRLKDALAVLEKAEKVSPEDLEIKVEKGRLLVSLKEYRKAMKVFQKITKLNPEYAPAYFFQASILEAEEKPKEAVEKHKKALSYSPDYIPALNNLAYLYADGHGPVETAVDLARRAKELAPRNGSVTDTLGWALYQSNRIDEAIQYLTEASEYLPGDPTVRYHLGLAYLKKGMNDKAEEQLKHAVRIGRQNDFAGFKDAEKLLEGLKR